MLAEEARWARNVSGAQPCLVRELRDSHLNDYRRKRAEELRQAARDRREPIGGRVDDPDFGVPGSGWFRPRSSDNAPAVELPAEEAKALLDRERRIISGPEQPRLLSHIEGGLVPAELTFCPPGARPLPFLTVSSPDIDGDVAFVASTVVCGGLCAMEWLYALRRDWTGWEIVAVTTTGAS